MTETRFYIELPADKHGNTGKPYAVVEARITYGPTPERPLGNPDRPYMAAVAPAEIVAAWPGWYAEGWVEVEGPARMLTDEEYDAIITGLRVTDTDTEGGRDA